jgi:hypothetical protein
MRAYDALNDVEGNLPFAVNASSLTLCWDVTFVGNRIAIPEGSDAAPLPAPWSNGSGEASSLILAGPTRSWAVLWETSKNSGDDSLWIAPIPDGWAFMLWSLHTGTGSGFPPGMLDRPHGNNHWGDRIRGVTWTPNPPSGDNDNRTILWPNGHQCGNGRYLLGRGIGFTSLKSDGTLIPKAAAAGTDSNEERPVGLR